MSSPETQKWYGANRPSCGLIQETGVISLVPQLLQDRKLFAFVQEKSKCSGFARLTLMRSVPEEGCSFLKKLKRAVPDAGRPWSTSYPLL